MGISGKALLGLVLQYTRARTRNRFHCLLPRGPSWALMWRNGGRWVCGLGRRHSFGGCTPPWRCCVQDRVQYPAFAPRTSEAAVVCGISVPVAHNRPHSPMHAVISVTCSCSPSLFGTRDQFHRRQFFHDWDRVMVSG